MRLRYAEQEKFLKILFTLDYLRDTDKYDKLINDDAELLELDESFKESYFEIVRRFYDLFE